MANKFVKFKNNRNFARTSTSGYTEITRDIRTEVRRMGVGSTAEWGSISGILNAQTDLWAELSSHSSRHLPLGTDALTTAAPITNLNGSSTNSTGIANSFSRSDHSHAIDVATSTVTGLLSNTDWTTFNNKLGNALASGNIFIGNVSNIATPVLVSGDASISNTGLLTIANDAVTTVKVLDGNITNAKLANSAINNTVTSVNAIDITVNASTSLGGTTTLNIPNASSTQRGALTNTDWNTFNSKQELLVSGTNIKTVNGNSLLGSGNVVISASSTLNYLEVNANYNILSNDDVINITTELVTVTLPTAVGIQGKKIIVKSSVNTSTINTSLSQTIDGETSLIIVKKYTSVNLVSTGANWIIV